ncbi:YjcQ family protein [Lactobacillus sp. ESL0680]|uniref:YjcQ family protein n=1 Tax=Lactobacillus sp. ESL0680 TaxID=2983210 RepID=UPI0023F7FAAC|nr:YjcQ family protein [Lactobacillus sp. ESL0680]WEV39273.1 YjcQ family protein [Lactobacillus sp. ESL0680]
MAKDDYFVIMYMLLKRLYDYLKQGKFISNQELEEIGSQYNQQYWAYILFNMSDQGYITGIIPIKALGGTGIKYDNVQITPAGIEYLFSNSMMERVKRTLKDIKGIIPGM